MVLIHPMQRIIMHWTAGADGVNDVEADSYHLLVGRDGTVTQGDFAISANIPPLMDNLYAAHTRACNSRSIGIAMDAMAGAQERPFKPGLYPITEIQVDAFCREVARLSVEWNIPVIRTKVLTHAEVQGTLGIRQNNKWDITWLPGMTKPGLPLDVGDVLRKRIRGYL